MKKIILLLCILFIRFNSHAQWDTLANIPVGLAFPVVVELNGEIHVIGGGSPFGATDIHLRYKPSTNVWDTLAPVPYLAQQPAGAVLNGKIHYFGGGFPNSGTPLQLHYAYDAGLDQWTQMDSLPVPRVIVKAAVINNKLYAMGGQPDKTRMDRYDPATDSWTSMNVLPDMAFWYSAIVVQNNEMYRFAGGGFSNPMDYVHKYDSTNDAWNLIAHLPIALHAPAGTSMGGNIYIGGGYYGPTPIMRKFDVSDSSFTTVAPFPEGRDYHDMITIDSCIYVVGGDNPDFPDMGISLIRNCNPDFVTSAGKSSETSLVVYPNPATDHISFELKNISSVNVDLVDLLGIKRMEFVVSSTSSVDISGLGDGIYFYRAYSSLGEKVFSGKIVVGR